MFFLALYGTEEYHLPDTVLAEISIVGWGLHTKKNTEYGQVYSVTQKYLFQCSLVALKAGRAWRQRTEASL